MTRKIISLGWNNHSQTFLTMFDTLRTTGAFADVTLACEGQYILAHKIVLAACSNYFKTLFSLDLNKEKNIIVVMKDVKFSELEALMDFMYRGKMEVVEQELPSVLDAAKSLELDVLSNDETVESPSRSRSSSNTSTETVILAVNPTPPNQSIINGHGQTNSTQGGHRLPAAKEALKSESAKRAAAIYPLAKRSRVNTPKSQKTDNNTQEVDPFAGIPTEIDPMEIHDGAALENLNDESEQVVTKLEATTILPEVVPIEVIDVDESENEEVLSMGGSKIQNENDGVSENADDDDEEELEMEEQLDDGANENTAEEGEGDGDGAGTSSSVAQRPKTRSRGRGRKRGPKSSISKKYPCKECEQSYAHLPSLNRHVRNDHPSSIQEKPKTRKR